MSRLAAAAALILVTACAGAQEPRGTTPSGAGAPAAASEEDEQECHEESVTGTNMSHTVCKTRAERQRDRDDAKDFNARTGRMTQTTKGN